MKAWKNQKAEQPFDAFIEDEYSEDEIKYMAYMDDMKANLIDDDDYRVEKMK
jgi:hypothetical protein